MWLMPARLFDAVVADQFMAGDLGRPLCRCEIGCNQRDAVGMGIPEAFDVAGAFGLCLCADMLWRVVQRRIDIDVVVEDVGCNRLPDGGGG